MKCDNDHKKHIFRRLSKQLLSKSERLLRNIPDQDPDLTNIQNEVGMLDIQTRWSLNKAAVITFGLHGDRSHISINKEGNIKRPAGPRKSVDLNSLEEKELNELFHRSSGGRRIVKRGLGKQMAGRQISHEVLCEYWSNALESKLGKNVNLPEFPAGDEVLRNLWSQIPIEDEEILVITAEQTQQAFYNLSNGTALLLRQFNSRNMEVV